MYSPGKLNKASTRYVPTTTVLEFTILTLMIPETESKVASRNYIVMPLFEKVSTGLPQITSGGPEYNLVAIIDYEGGLLIMYRTVYVGA